MNNSPLIVGITGAFGSGKSTAASFFESHGFKKIILSSFLEEEALKRGVKRVTRKILQDIGNEWRERHGNGILVKKALDSILEGNYRKVVIDGIRNIGEIGELKKHNSFVLFAILCDRKTRFERLKKLKRREDLTWELFNRLDTRDLGIGEIKSGLQVAFCIAISDFYITNNEAREKFLADLSIFFEANIL